MPYVLKINTRSTSTIVSQCRRKPSQKSTWVEESRRRYVPPKLGNSKSRQRYFGISMGKKNVFLFPPPAAQYSNLQVLQKRKRRNFLQPKSKQPSAITVIVEDILHLGCPKGTSALRSCWTYSSVRVLDSWCAQRR